MRCLRGVDTLTAVGLCAEIGDFERFARPGQSPRRLLVEAAWHYRKRPAIGKKLSDRQDGQPAQAVAIAWSAQQRLHRTWTRLEQRAKRRMIIAIAAARELAGFAWAICQIE